MGNVETAAEHQRRSQRGPAVDRLRLEDGVVGGKDAAFQHVENIDLARLGPLAQQWEVQVRQDELSEGARGNVAGDVALLVAAHPVGHDVQPQRPQVEVAAEFGGDRQTGVLVAVAHGAYLAAIAAVEEGDGCGIHGIT